MVNVASELPRRGAALGATECHELSRIHIHRSSTNKPRCEHMFMRAAVATAKDATTSAIFIPNSQRPRHVVNAWDEYCWVFSCDICTLENAVELAVSVPCDIQ